MYSPIRVRQVNHGFSQDDDSQSRHLGSATRTSAVSSARDSLSNYLHSQNESQSYDDSVAHNFPLSRQYGTEEEGEETHDESPTDVRRLSPIPRTHMLYNTCIPSVVVVPSVPMLGGLCHISTSSAARSERTAGAHSDDLVVGDRLFLPLWLTQTLHEHGIVRVEFPKMYSQDILKSLDAAPEHVDLFTLHPYYFSLGKELCKICDSVEGDRTWEVGDTSSVYVGESGMTPLGEVICQKLDSAREKRKRLILTHTAERLSDKLSKSVEGITRDEMARPPFKPMEPQRLYDKL